MEEASSVCSEVSQLRRILLASKLLPKDTPTYWNIVTNFAFKGESIKPKCDEVRLLIDNIQVLDNGSLEFDDKIQKELIYQEGFQGHQLGIVLISNTSCKLCGGDLLVRADRPSFVTGYTNSYGTIPITHFRKYCNKRGCSFSQHYGFHTHGEDIEYDHDWQALPYFMCTHKTAFEMKMLEELLIGQVSYNQRCDILFMVTKIKEK